MSDVLDFTAARRAAHPPERTGATSIEESVRLYSEAEAMTVVQSPHHGKAGPESTACASPLCAHLVDHPRSGRVVACGNAARMTVCDAHICEEHAGDHRAHCTTCAAAEAAFEAGRPAPAFRSSEPAGGRRNRRERLKWISRFDITLE